MRLVWQELGGVPVEVVHVLLALRLRWPLARVRPRVEHRLVCDSSLLRHLEQRLLRGISR